jgi:hypothetical protein
VIEWWVDRGLAKLIVQAKAEYPGMVVGTIGDSAHRSESNSDHNPKANGSVDAGDFMINGAFTFEKAREFYDQLKSGDDYRIKYAIFDRRIFQNGSERPYSGNDPHTNHVHVSVYETNDTSDWDIFMNITDAQLDAIAKRVWEYLVDIDTTAEGKNMQQTGSVLRYTSKEHHDILNAVRDLTAVVTNKQP